MFSPHRIVIRDVHNFTWAMIMSLIKFNIKNHLIPGIKQDKMVE